MRNNNKSIEIDMMEKVVRFLLMTSLFISIQMVSTSFGQEQLRGNMQLKMNGDGFVIQPIILIHTMQMYLYLRL